jgi:hypothetical protein
MSIQRLLAIGFIYICATVAWFALGGSLLARTGEFDSRLEREVAMLWGGHHTQAAPEAWVERPRVVVEHVTEKAANGQTVVRDITKQQTDRIGVPLDSSHVTVDLDLDQRQKGLLWYDTYAVRVTAGWRVRNPDREPRRLIVSVKFPSTDGIYDGFEFRAANTSAQSVTDLSQGARVVIDVGPNQEVPVELRYRSRGLGDWTYAFSPSGIAQVRDFALVMHTNFDAIDFPAGTMSPTAKTRRDGGWELTWKFDSLVTGQRIGMDLPDRLNPGPLAARITWFAPVSLLFFLSVMVMLGVLRSHNLHPMNYAFLSAAFFAFHLLVAYLVDHLELHASFVIASLTSVALVVSYLRLVSGTRFAVREAGLAQFVFLILFSYAFFFEGYTGLTVTIGAIVTLFVLMQLTARIDWSVVFAKREAA